MHPCALLSVSLLNPVCCCCCCCCCSLMCVRVCVLVVMEREEEKKKARKSCKTWTNQESANRSKSLLLPSKPFTHQTHKRWGRLALLPMLTRPPAPQHRCGSKHHRPCSTLLTAALQRRRRQQQQHNSLPATAPAPVEAIHTTRAKPQPTPV